MQMNSDPRLEFGLETPLIMESEAPDAAHLLESAKDQMCHLLDIENDEDWKVRHTFPLSSPCTMNAAK